MKRLLKNKKALSPVVAAIILIAVTVAVSIAVAAWMGSLTIGFMETAEVTITDVTFYSNDTIAVTTINTGTSAATVSSARVNGGAVTMNPAAGGTLEAGGNAVTFRLTGTTLNEGSKYSINIFANDGSLLSSHTATAILTPVT